MLLRRPRWMGWAEEIEEAPWPERPSQDRVVLLLGKSLPWKPTCAT